MIVAIDGPAASGKTTVAREAARRLGFAVLPTGATYRALALAALERNIPPDDQQALARLADQVRIEVDGRPEASRVFLDGEEVSEALRSPEVARFASALSRHPEVRRRLVNLQRELADRFGNVVAEGRDMTTVVFPDAAVKVYLDASLEERARRRLSELRAIGRADTGIDPDAVRADLERRDRQDSSREAAPLVRSPEAHYIDTTPLSVDEVVGRIVELVRQARDEA